MQLEKKDTKEAYNKLNNDIKKNLIEWLKDDYLTESKLEYTKPQIIELVENLLQGLR